MKFVTEVEQLLDLIEKIVPFDENIRRPAWNEVKSALDDFLIDFLIDNHELSKEIELEKDKVNLGIRGTGKHIKNVLEMIDDDEEGG